MICELHLNIVEEEEEEEMMIWFLKFTIKLLR
jgi:hypothetical protein